MNFLTAYRYYHIEPASLSKTQSNDHKRRMEIKYYNEIYSSIDIFILLFGY